MAADAVQRWKNQDYPVRELVIIDDIDFPSFPAGIEEAGVLYLAIPGRFRVGAKRNFACSMTSGRWICHWDDDDMSGPHRITDQVNRLLTTGERVTGYVPVLFIDETGEWWLYDTNNPACCPGSSLMYERSVWEGKPFLQVPSGEDNHFINGLEIAAAPAGRNFVATIHSNNTSERKLKQKPWRYMPQEGLDRYATVDNH